MPAWGMFFAHDCDVRRHVIFDLHDPLNPRVAASFTDMAGYMHPHSYLRLPNGHVLVSFQHSQASMHSGGVGQTGGLVEIDDTGKLTRSASNADPPFPDAWLTPYSLVPLPEIDRVVSTNSSMNEDGMFRGVTYQVWRLSDLKLLSTNYLDVGENRYAQISPEEPRRGPDGSVFVQTLSCGIEHVTNIGSSVPKSQLVYMFPGRFCGVPTIVGHYLIQSVPSYHGIVALDIANPSRPLEVSRVKLDDVISPHWTGWDAKTRRLVVTGYNEHRLFMLTLDEKTGALALDTAFHDAS